MKIKKSALLALLPFLFSCEPINRYFHLKDDNIIEESGEMILEAKTGIQADFTPTSPEK